MSCTEIFGRRAGIPMTDSPIAFLTLLVLTLFNASMAFSQEQGKSRGLDPGSGIAAKYIGDAGIESDASVIFAKGMRRGPWSGMGFQLVESGGVPLEGLKLRTSMDLKTNHLWLEHFVNEGAQRMNKMRSPNRVNRVWFDDIVVATEYIGPLASERARGTTARTSPTAASGSKAIKFFSNEVADEPTIQGILFSESFDDTNLLNRGWYDSTNKIRISNKDAYAGAGCIEYKWEDGGKVVGSRGLRHLFAPTEVVYIRFYMKLSKGWGWSGRSYHPHMLHFLTTENSKYHGPARSHLTLYIEANSGRLRLGATDMQNAGAPHGLTQGPLRGGYNGKLYDSKEALLGDADWHCIEAMFKLNSVDVENDKWNVDGELRG